MDLILRTHWDLNGNVELKEFAHFLWEGTHGSGNPVGEPLVKARR